MIDIKQTLLSAIFITLCYSSFGQLTVDFNLSGNTLASYLGTGSSNPYEGLEDLFFSISPDGIPQYGREVRWNLRSNTNDEARHYRVKKGDWGRAAISDSIISVTSIESQWADPADTPDMHMGNNWVKLSKAWNFSSGAFNIIVLSIKNQGSDKISGDLQLSYPTEDLNVSEVKIYNNWATINGVHEGASNETYFLSFEGLLPDEVRHIYFYFDIQKEKRMLDEGFLSASLLNYQTTTLNVDRSNPPHDPNGLTLVNALMNTPPITNCTPFADHPVLADVCDRGVPFWYYNQGADLEKCKFPSGTEPEYCDLPYSLNYPYCNIDKEELIYRITCLNDGLGTARKVVMRVLFDGPHVINENYFSGLNFSHDAYTYWEYPGAEFIFEEINLPGLNDPNVVYMYNECTAHAVFSIETLCSSGDEIIGGGEVEFYDLDNVLADKLATNKVIAVPRQGEFDNIDPLCLNCVESLGESGANNTSEAYKISSSTGNDYITLSRFGIEEFETLSENVSIQIIDVAGRVIKHQSVPAELLIADYHINMSNSPSGIYFLSIISGENKFYKKFVH